MSDIRNLLTAKDYSLIDMYRENYVSEDQVYHIGDGMIPSFDLLMPWSEAKSEFLTTLFGNQLILSRELGFTKDVTTVLEMTQEVCALLHAAREAVR